MNKPELIFKDYMPAQISLEERYYDELHDVITNLMALLLAYFDEEENITLLGVLQIYEQFYAQHAKQLEYINNKCAHSIVDLGHYVYEEAVLKSGLVATTLPLWTNQNLIQGLNVKTNNLLDTVRGRFVAMLPVSISPINHAVFTDENTKDDLIRRCNNSIMRYVREAIGTALVSTIVYQAMSNGATEYIGSHVHDDRTREQHAKDNDEKTWRRFDNPPPSGLPGTEPNCRCEIERAR